MNINSSYNIGKFCEFIARLYLRFHGYKIIESRYITGRGTNASELDIISIKSNTLIFIEVKKRKSISDALFAIQQTENRLKNSAEIYIKRHHFNNINNFRFDAICFNNKYQLRHYKNIIKN